MKPKKPGFIWLQGTGSTLNQQVRQFHEVVMGQPIGEKPMTPAADRVRLRLRLIAEEFFEILESCGLNEGAFDDLTAAKKRVEDLIARPTRGVVDLPAFVDGLGDLDYVVEGARLEFGVDGAPIADAIHEANIKKAGAPKRKDGKQTKPEGWTAPDIEGELVKQGWVKP